jgi:hypothetical protein
MRANVVLMDGEVVGVIGVARHPEWGTYFSEFKPQLQEHLNSITVWRAIKDSMTYVKQYKGPVLSIADDAESCVVMHRLGFTHLHGAWHGWLG